MIIGKSSVDMNSVSTNTISYERTDEQLMKNALGNNAIYQSNDYKVIYETKMAEKSTSYNEKGRDDSSKKENEENGDSLISDRYMPGSLISPSQSSIERNSVQNLLSKLRDYLYNMRQQILEFLTNGRYTTKFEDGKFALSFSGAENANVWHCVNSTKVTVREEQTMEFETTGKVITEDGRELEFNLSVTMNRSFEESMEEISSSDVVIFTDPLVISLNSNPVSVSDQKWMFDLDCDGKKDSISLLSKGSGFLVFDRDGNGVIDDGSELFGTTSGNGFSDLKAFDSDGNGWIDEADEMYDKLSVWVKDDSGADKLMSLKAANVGAIYLNAIKTAFSMKSGENNNYNAELRRAGMYLSENGIAHMMGQIDMVNA